MHFIMELLWFSTAFTLECDLCVQYNKYPWFVIEERIHFILLILISLFDFETFLPFWSSASIASYWNHWFSMFDNFSFLQFTIQRNCNSLPWATLPFKTLSADTFTDHHDNVNDKILWTAMSAFRAKNFYNKCLTH